MSPTRRTAAKAMSAYWSGWPRLAAAAVGTGLTVCAPWPLAVVEQLPESGLQPCAMALPREPAPVPVPVPALVPAPALVLAPGLALVPVELVLDALALGLTGVGVLAPPVPVVHCVVPCLSHVGGSGSFAARVLVPLVENVGLWHCWICAVVWLGTWFPGIF